MPIDHSTVISERAEKAKAAIPDLEAQRRSTAQRLKDLRIGRQTYAFEWDVERNSHSLARWEDSERQIIQLEREQTRLTLSLAEATTRAASPSAKDLAHARLAGVAKALREIRGPVAISALKNAGLAQPPAAHIARAAEVVAEARALLGAMLDLTHDREQFGGVWAELSLAQWLAGSSNSQWILTHVKPLPPTRYPWADDLDLVRGLTTPAASLTAA